MEESIQYQMFIGCNDSFSKEEVIDIQNLEDAVASFFKRHHIDFTLLRVKGGYRHENGPFVIENTLCITVIGAPTFDIVKLAKDFSEYMNQEKVLIVKSYINKTFS